jgi:patatin-like phospholipase/acyl hydrolase
MPYKSKILSIDGGGIRGLISAKILAKIEELTGNRISKMFDLIAGTSSGSLLAAGLTKPQSDNSQEPAYTAKQLVDIFRGQDGRDIFYEPLLERLTKVDDIIRPKYSSEGRNNVLTKYLGDTPIKDAVTEVFITSYDITLRLPVFFTSKSNKEEKESRVFRKICTGFSMKQATMASSAAPTYFEPYQVATNHPGTEGFYVLVDGGVFANNPTSLAIMEVIIDKKKTGERIDLEDILVVSVGTGSLTRRYPYDKAKNWGLLGWVEPLLNITLDGSSESVAVQLEQLLPKAQDKPSQYYRFQGFLDKGDDNIDVTKTENIENLEKLADQIINEKSDEEWKELCQQLLS